jgi:hypothetical protein
VLFIFCCAHPFGERVLLTHIRPGFRMAVIVVAAEVIDVRPGTCPDDRVAGAMRPCQSFRGILVSAGFSFIESLVPVRQARPTSALRRRSRLFGWSGALALPKKSMGTNTRLKGLGDRDDPRSRSSARPEVGEARATSATR